MRPMASAAVMPACAGIHDLRNAALHDEVVDTRPAAGHDGPKLTGG